MEPAATSSKSVLTELHSGVEVTPLRETDTEAFLQHFEDQVYWQWTCNIPYPYTREHAQAWLAYRREQVRHHEVDSALALRRADGLLIGGVGCMEVTPGKTHCAELGYWLARDHWGQGLMRTAVAWYIGYAWETLQLGKLTALVFEGNHASAHILEANGFSLEGNMPRHVRKGDRVLDVRLYGLVRP